MGFPKKPVVYATAILGIVYAVSSTILDHKLRLR